MKAVIRLLQPVEARARAEPCEQGLEQCPFGERIACALEEKHRDLNLCQVLGASVRGTMRGVQREAEKSEPTNTGQGRERLCLGGHASAEGAPAGDERQAGGES